MNTIVRSAVIASIFLAPLGSQSARATEAKSPASEVNVGGSIALLWAPLYIAEQQGLFEKHGVKVKILPFSSGRATQEAVVGGGVLWGTVPETPAMFAYTNNLPVRIIGVMGAYELLQMVSTNDIKKIEDLKGKRVGIARGATPDYVLAAALKKVGMTVDDVTTINLTPTDMVTSLVNNEIDAFLWTEPHTSQAVNLGGGKFHATLLSGYVTYGSVAALKDTIEHDPATLVKSLCALKEATEYMKENKDAAITYVAEYIKVDKSIVAKEWERIPFELTLDKAAYVAEVERQANWALNSGLLPGGTALPDYQQIVETSIYEQSKNCDNSK
jgi:NitT/TauT family transport system substrate-binding protein